MEYNFDTLAAAFGTNKAAESEGVWLDYSDKIAVRLRRTTDPVFKKAQRKAFKRFKHLGSNLGPEHEDIINNESVANGLITDWKIAGGPAFSPEAALAAFKQLPDFRRWCIEQGDDVANFKDDVEDDRGNSSGTSTGSVDGEALKD